MKFLKALATTVCALALAGAAQADTYTDSSDNYEYETQLATGANHGSGFYPWEIVRQDNGDGWAGFGVWNPSANGFKGSWEGKDKAFGIIGKGPERSVTATRRFQAPLDVGDSFSFDMAVYWDPNSGEDALKGFVLGAGGADVVTVNHLSNPGNISIATSAGTTADNEILNAFGQFPMTWTFTAKDATTLSVTATPRDGSETAYEADLTVETSAIDRIRLQSAKQNNVENLSPEAIEAGETDQDWADRRQTYFDNFALTLAATLPDPVDLEFTSGQWAVSNATQTLSFTLHRSSSDGELIVDVKSSNPAFVAETSVTFADGEADVTFPVTATLTGSGNEAVITAVSTGEAASYTVRGPIFSRSVQDGKWQFNSGESANFWVNWGDNGVSVDLSKVTVSSDPKGAVDLPAALSWEYEEGGAYAAAAFTAVSTGRISFQFDGVEFDNWGVEVLTYGLELSGPATAKTGATCTFTVKGTLDGEEGGGTVTVDPAAGVTIDPASFNLTEPEEDGFYYQNIEITFAYPGDYTIAVKSLNYEAAPLSVSVSEPADFSDYIAYDDGSLYAGDFDASAIGAGTDKFQAWDIVTQNSGGIFLATTAPDASVLTDGAAFGIWANGADGAELQVRRPFVNSLGDGQAFSVVLSPNYREGTKGVKFMGEWEGNWYERAEFFYSDYGYFYKLDGDSDATSLGWEFSADAITITLQKAADGTSYTLTFQRGGETVAKESITSFQGTVDGVQFYSYQGGPGDENNLVFNKLAIEQVEEPVEPVVKRNIGIIGTWNPDATGDYDFYVGPAEASDEAIGTVALTVTPDDGRITISPASVEVPGDNVAAFTVTVNSLPADGEQAVMYTIKATPVDELVNSAEFNVTPAQPYVYLSSDNNQLTTDDGPIGLILHASPARYGEYRITTDDDSVFSIPENYQTVTLSEEQPEATFFVDIVGPSGENGASIYATLGEGEAWCDYRFWVSEGSDDPYADILRITAMDKADPNMVLTVDGTPATAYGATEIVGGDWAWQPLDDATIAGDKVTVPMTGRPYLIIKVEK